MILLRNFYVGISSWNSHVLDTLIGGNFLGAPALEAYTLIESLVGVPPTNVVKTEPTIEKASKRLDSLEKIVPNLLNDAIQTNELIGSVNKRITVLEDSIANDDRTFRIGKLEEAMKTLSLTFSSLGFKKEKAFVGKEQRFMHVPKIPKSRTWDFKLDKTFSSTKSVLHIESSSGKSNIIEASSGSLEEVNGVDAPPLDNT